MGEAWLTEYFVEQQHAGAATETNARSHVETIARWLEAHDICLEELDRTQVKGLHAHLAGRSPATRATTSLLPEGVDAAARVTMAEALGLPGLSGKRSTLRRAVRAEDLAPAGRRDNSPLYRIADVYRTAGRLPGHDQASCRQGRVRSTDGYTQAVIRAIDRTLHQVCDFAREVHRVDIPDDWRNLTPAKSAKPAGRPAPLRSVVTLSEAAAMGAQMHVVHQLVLWLLRILGLRISEAFGVEASDVLDFGPSEPGALWVHRQGGKTFGTRDATTGLVVHTPNVERVKNAQSERVLVVPPTLMAVIRATIRTFHTDPDGHVDRCARLVPGLRKRNSGGQSAFRAALKRTAPALHTVTSAFTDEQLENMIRPHDFRRAVITDLSVAAIAEVAARRYAGHRAGNDVHAAHYLVDDPEMRQIREISNVLQKDIDDQVGESLLIPTAIRCTTGSQPAWAPQAHRIDAELTELGWLKSPQSADSEPLFSVTEAAARLGVTAKTVRQWARIGAIPAQKCPESGQGWLIPRDVLTAKNAQLDSLTIRAVAAELCEDRDTVRSYILAEHLGTQRFGVRGLVLTAEAAYAVRNHFRNERALYARAMRVSDAAEALEMKAAEVDRALAVGVLTPDSRAHDGARMVTRESVAQLSAARGNDRSRTGADFVSIVAAAEILSCDTEWIGREIASGRLTAARAGRRPGVTRSSLLAALATR